MLMSQAILFEETLKTADCVPYNDKHEAYDLRLNTFSQSHLGFDLQEAITLVLSWEKDARIE